MCNYQAVINVSRPILPYSFHFKKIDSRPVVAQRRERVYFVGYRDGHPFEFPEIKGNCPVIRDIIEAKVDPSYTLTDGTWQYVLHRQATTNWCNKVIMGLDEPSHTLTATYRAKPLNKQKGKKNPRRFTERECLRLMGFPEQFEVLGSRTQCYRQIGNSVVVPVIEQIGRAIVDQMPKYEKRMKGAVKDPGRSL